jgi:hypothetical protein
MSVVKIFVTQQTLAAIDEWKRGPQATLEPIDAELEVITESGPLHVIPDRVIFVNTDKVINVQPNSVKVQTHGKVTR